MSREEINAFLGAGTVYQGKLTFQGAVRVDGVFSGEISSEGALIAGKDAVIEARLDVAQGRRADRHGGKPRAGSGGRRRH